MNRREMLRTSGAAALTLGLSRFPLGWIAAADTPRRRILMFTRSVSFEHPVVHRKGTDLSLAEQIATDLGKKHGFEVTCSKDGRIFLSDTFKDFDGFLFETQGDLGSEKSLDGQPAVPPEGKKALLQAIADGKGFAGCHCASDTYHSKGHTGRNPFHNQPKDEIDPYIRMVGGEFARHGEQQPARMHVVDPHFPGMKGLDDFELKEEWYSLKNFAPDLHVLLVQVTEGMKNLDYQRPNYPATWAHKYEKGRVFFTSMGHREDVWQNEVFQQILLGGLSWALGNVDAEIPPNQEKAAPHADELPKPKEAKKS
jgi:type 1 glutamine amidotransferase